MKLTQPQISTLAIICLLLLSLSKLSACCIEDNTTLTELIFQGKPGMTIFSCRIITSTNGEELVSTAEVIKIYFGNLDTGLVTLHTGSENSSTKGARMPVGKSYLIFGYGQGRSYSCGGICDRWTTLITDAPNLKNELETLDHISTVYKNRITENALIKDSKGTVIASGRFSKGKAVGIWKHFNKDGIIKAEFDIEAGKVSQFYPNGNIQTERTKKGKTEALIMYSKEFNQRKITSYVHVFNDTGYTSTYFDYYTNGNLKNFRTSIAKGSKNTSYVPTDGVTDNEDYYEDGKPKALGHMRNGLRVGLWKLYDRNGNKTVVDYRYEKGAFPFHQAGKWYFTDKEKQRIDCFNYDSIIPAILNCYILVKNKKMALANAIQGVAMTEFMFDTLYFNGVDGFTGISGNENLHVSFQTGEVSSNTGKSYISRHTPATQKKYFEVYKQNGKEGFLAARVDNKAISDTFPAVYDSIIETNDGFALVRTEAKWGTINNQGKYSVEPQFDSVNYLTAGGSSVVLITKNNLQGLLEMGVVVIAPLYKSLIPFRQGYAFVSTPEGHSGYVSKDGKEWF